MVGLGPRKPPSRKGQYALLRLQFMPQNLAMDGSILPVYLNAINSYKLTLGFNLNFNF